MHISEGLLSAPVLVGGGVLAAGGVAMGLRRLDYERIPHAAVLSSAFFVASLIHVPVMGSSAHLVLNGLCGLILGWVTFPALLVALVLQAQFFGFGGPTVLGVNTVIMALPAVVAYLLFRPVLQAESTGPLRAGLFGFLAGALSIALSGVLAAGALRLRGQSFTVAAAAILGAHVPILIVEGLVTAHVVGFLRKVRPELLRAPAGRILSEEVAGA